MKIIKIYSQKELDELPKSFKEDTEIQICGEIKEFKHIFKNGYVSLVRGGSIFDVSGGSISYVSGGSISYVRGGSISLVSGGSISLVSGGSISDVSGGSISDVSGGSISDVSGGSISDVSGGSIKRVWGNTIIEVLSKCILESILNPAIIIFRNGYSQKFTGNAKSIITGEAKYSKSGFEMLVESEKDSIILYKSVNPKTRCDFYSGKIKYEGIVKCPDWDSNSGLQCGSGLHLSHSPVIANNYNKGLILKCEVAKSDYVVFAEDITKVRCKEVKVLGECDMEGNLINLKK